MTPKSIKLPGGDHPITINPHPARVIVSAAGKVIADTKEALSLRESTYPAVLYAEVVRRRTKSHRRDSL